MSASNKKTPPSVERTICSAVESGVKMAEVASMFRVSIGCVSQIMRRNGFRRVWVKLPRIIL